MSVDKTESNRSTATAHNSTKDFVRFVRNGLAHANARAPMLNSFNDKLFYAMKNKSIERAVAWLRDVMRKRLPQSLIKQKRPQDFSWSRRTSATNAGAVELH
jgi:hypothetical protein